jgi:hypothetical protein
MKSPDHPLMAQIIGWTGVLPGGQDVVTPMDIRHGKTPKRGIWRRGGREKRFGRPNRFVGRCPVKRNGPKYI